MFIRGISTLATSSLLLAACVAPQSDQQSISVRSGVVVPAGVPCERIQERHRGTVAGCENFITDPTNAMSREELIDLNVRFSQEVTTFVNFDFDRDELRPDARAILDQQAAWIAQYPELSFSVFGHTDLVGSSDYNFDLAKRRADAVVEYLVTRGASVEQLDSIVSFGLTQPIIQTPNPEERNRRAVTEVSGYLRPGPAAALVAIPCEILESAFLPTYSQCIDVISDSSTDVISVPVVPEPPTRTVRTTSASYESRSGDIGGGASISDDGNGNSEREAFGRTGPADEPRTTTFARSVSNTEDGDRQSANATGRVGDVQATSPSPSGDVETISATGRVGTVTATSP